MGEWVMAWVGSLGASTNDPIVLLVLAGATALEYIFPPFPGDAITLFGVVLVSSYSWNLPLVFAVLMLGSSVGSLVAFDAGRRWQKKRIASDEPRRLDRLVRKFRNHGSWYLVLNRFVPGIRPLFFVAAGLAGMSTRRMLLLSALSAALWNAALLSAGFIVGNNLVELKHWLATYSTVAISVVLVVLLSYGAWRVWSKRGST